MAENIIYLLNNSEIAVEMGKKGRERILSKCKPDLRILDIKNLFFQLVEKGHFSMEISESNQEK